MSTLDDFTRGYIECALWCSYDNADESGGEPLDANHSADDFSPDTLQAIVEECRMFQLNCAPALAVAYEHAGYNPARAGHDFWLTRNGHGVGYWDRDLGGIGDILADAARAAGERDLYVGDDGKVHQS